MCRVIYREIVLRPTPIIVTFQAFAMTGWRVGFGLFPPALVDAATNLAINSWTCLPPFVAAGAVAALDGPTECTTEMREEFMRRRDEVFKRLNKIDRITIQV